MKVSSMKVRWTIDLVFSAAAFGAGVWAQQTATGTTTESAVRSVSSVAGAHISASNAKPAKVSRWNRRKAEKMFLAGANAIEKGDPSAAEKDFERAHEFNPNNQRHPLLAKIARQYVITQLVQQAKNEWFLGHKDNSLAVLEKALRFDLENPMVAEYIATLAADVPARVPELHARGGEASEPFALTPQQGQHTFHLRADKRNMILQVLNAFGIQAAVDASVNSQSIHFDTDEVDFAEATELLKFATDTFFVPLDSKSVIVVADTKDNRNKFEHRVMKTFYLQGLSSKELTEMGNIARNVLGVEQSTMEPGKNTLTVRAPEPELEVLDEICAELSGGRSQLQLEVSLYEIDKTKAANVGMVLPSSTTVFNVPSEINSILKNSASLIDQLLKSDPSLAGNYQAILAALIASGALTGTVFNGPFAVFGGGLTETGLTFNGVSINVLLNSSDARSFDQQELRVLDQEEATIRSGERYPIMTSSYSSLAGSSSSNGAIPQIQYEDLGLTLKVTPHVDLGNEVSLNLDMKISSLAGSSLNNIPILANRQYAGMVSLHLGDSALLVSDLSKQESLEITGVPGLSDLPGFSGATNRQDTKDIMELAIVITPHLVRLAHRDTAGPMLLLPHH